MKRLLLLPLFLSCACTTDWATDGAVGWRHVDVKVRGVDVVPVFVAAPWNGQGPALAADGVVLVPGGRVDPSRYQWLAKALARTGRAVAIPSFPLDLAILSTPDMEVARKVLVDGHAPSATPALASGRLVAMGHSLGGVVAADQVHDYDALVLLASYPASDDALATFSGPVLSLAGELDCEVGIDQAREGIGSRAGPRFLAVIEGLTHYGFTDSLGEDRASGCAPRLSLEEGHARIVRLIDSFLSGSLQATEGVTLEEVP